MNKRYDLPEKGQLPLPSPRSPRALDERVLKAAREQLPTRQRYRQPWWLAGAATASVLVIAVMLTETATPPAPSAISSNKPVPVAAEEMAPMAAPVANTFAGQSAKVRSAQPQSDRSSSAMAAESRQAIVKDENTKEAVGEQAVPAALKRQLFSYADSMEEAETLSTPQDIAKSLQPLATLLQLGEEEEAYRGYETLRESCPDCDLPDTLEEALEFSYPPSP